MSQRFFLVFVLCMTPLAGLGCASPESLPASDTYAQRFDGPWRIALVEGQQVFSDYVFGADGKLTNLLSVADGQPVDPMQGAAMVRCPGVADVPACTFGSTWYSRGVDTLVIDGTCTDAVARDIELQFADETRTPGVAVHTVGGEPGWTQGAAWRYQKCDLHPCGG